MQTLPSIEYKGLTIIIDKPSRFDTDHLLTGQPGQWLNEVLPFPIDACDIRDINVNTPFLENTKRIALLGNKAVEKYYGNPALHGYPFQVKGIPAMIGHYPQDCCDHRSIEAHEDPDEEPISDRETKDISPTKRSNYRFWTEWHLRKFLLQSPAEEPKIQPKFYPHANHIVSILRDTRAQDIYLDIETSRIHRALTCIGFSTSALWPAVYCIPVYRPDGTIAYSDFHKIYKAFASAFTTQENTIVAHNISFDLLVLHAFYKFPLPNKVYDTMLANHRAFPEVEKSLSHVIAQWTWQPYHKDTSTEALNTFQEQRLWLYNAKDVYCLKLIKDAQLTYSNSIAGLKESIVQVNAMVAPYLRNSVTGLNLDRATLLETAAKLRKHTTLYAKICSILVGAPFNPGSTKQCGEYFHNLLNYPIIERTAKGAPTLGRKQLYQLVVKYDNPLISAILRYRKTAKDLSMLESELFTTS